LRLDLIIVHVFFMYLIETELNIVLQAVLYLDTTDIQYILCIVMLTVRLAVLKSKFLTELVAVPDITLTNHTEFKDLNC
jgi:fucose 4-O-acetylase-like acetyltransferase